MVREVDAALVPGVERVVGSLHVGTCCTRRTSRPGDVSATRASSRGSPRRNAAANPAQPKSDELARLQQELATGGHGHRGAAAGGRALGEACRHRRRRTSPGRRRCSTPVDSTSEVVMTGLTALIAAVGVVAACLALHVSRARYPRGAGSRRQRPDRGSPRRLPALVRTRCRRLVCRRCGRRGRVVLAVELPRAVVLRCLVSRVVRVQGVAALIVGRWTVLRHGHLLLHGHRARS